MSDSTIRHCWEEFMADGAGSKLYQRENTTNIVALDIEVKHKKTFFRLETLFYGHENCNNLYHTFYCFAFIGLCILVL